MSIASMAMVAPDALTDLGLSQEKARIVTVDLGMFDEGYVDVEFQFNPEHIQVTKKLDWKEGDSMSTRNTPDVKFSGGKQAEYSLKLVFDTSQNFEYRDVRMYTNELLKLTMMFGEVAEDREWPPRIAFQWGAFTLFLAVVKKVVIDYTLFDPDGTPIRASADIDFLQDDDSDDYAGSTNPTTRTEARKTHIVRQGERLDMIAYREYGAPQHWRHLAQANGLRDPRALQPGQILILPPLP